MFERTYFEECPAPWPVVLVELDEGPLFISNLVDGDAYALTEGTRLVVDYLDCEDDAGTYSLPVFRVA